MYHSCIVGVCRKSSKNHGGLKFQNMYQNALGCGSVIGILCSQAKVTLL